MALRASFLEKKSLLNGRGQGEDHTECDYGWLNE